MLQSINSNINFGCKLSMGDAILLGSGRKEANKIIANITGNPKFAQNDLPLVRITVAEMMENSFPRLSKIFKQALFASPKDLERIVTKAKTNVGIVLDVSTDAVKTSANWAKDAIELMA